MIDIKIKEDCCGCNACTVICPEKCISMQTDNEGFIYPIVDKDKCIDCGLCEEVCPILNKRKDDVERFEKPFVYAAYNINRDVRLDSTSGGIFSALAEKIFSQGGYVSGAIYNKDHSVSHIVTNDKSKLPDLRSSKYLQSFTGNLYEDIKQLLIKGKKVLVCGTPCQITALYAYLNSDYDNLITCDFICKGVNSPKVFQKYIKMLELQYKSKAVKIKFKNKTFGWHRFSTKVDFLNGKSYIKDRYHDPFMIGYLQSGNFARPSCYSCQFKGFPQKSDITLGDFWGIENIDKTMDQDIGTSLIMVNSDKGMTFFESLGNAIIKKEFKKEDAEKGNLAMNNPLKATNNDRKAFFDALDKMPFKQVAKKFFPMSLLLQKGERKLRIIKIIFKYAFSLGFSLHTWWQFIYYNLICKKIQMVGIFKFRPLKYCRLSIHKSAKLKLNSSLIMGIKQVKSSHLETRLLLESNSKMIVNGDFSIYCNSYIRVVKEGELTLNGGFINENVQITCASKIKIGDRCAIARDVIIRDYDGHNILEPDFKIAKPITIGNHVWIGSRATILKGVTIGNGAIIAAGAIVTKNIPDNCVAAGIPAKVIKENIKWK